MSFLPNMATEDFLSCLSRTALEATAETAGVPGRIKVKDTRAALVEHFAEGKLVHPAALLRAIHGRRAVVGGRHTPSVDSDWRMSATIAMRWRISFPVGDARGRQFRVRGRGRRGFPRGRRIA
jgi:hypothetical protein